MFKKTLVLSTGLAVGALSPVASAEETFNLSVAHFVPAQHIGVEHGTGVFMEEATKATDGQVQFTFYPAQQMGKASQFLDLLKAGAVDIAEVGTGYVSSDQMPLLGVLEMPGLVDDICDGTRASRVVGDPGGVMYDAEYEPNGVRVLSYYVYPPYGPSASRNPINAVADLQGMKLRNAGGAMELSVAAVGGVPVKMASPEVYQSLSRGTLDSALSSYLTVEDYDLSEVTDYGTTGYSFGTPGIFAMISEKKFQSLPENVQDALVEAGKKAEHEFCTFASQREAQLIEDLRASGMTIREWTDAEKDQLNDLVADIPASWAENLNKRGKPGAETLASFKEALTNKE